MSKTTIEWTHRPGTGGEVWNPTTGCNKVDRGCKNCYAEVMHKRLQAMGQKKYTLPFLKGPVMHHELIDLPHTWKTPRTVFVDSMSDLFHKDVPHDFQRKILSTMRATPQHTYLVLSKRPENLLYYQEVRKCEIPTWSFPPNVWVGTSVHDQASLELRGPLLAQLDAVVRFLSAEPLLGPLTLPVDANDGSGFFEWVICGGESGPHASPMHPAWVRSLRDQCAAQRTAFFFKQWGMWELASEAPVQQPGEKRHNIYTYDMDGHPTKFTRRPQKSGNLLDGKLHQAFPTTAYARRSTN